MSRIDFHTGLAWQIRKDYDFAMQFEHVAEQFVPRKLEDVFPFYADEMNLEKITPPFLNFKVLRKSTPEIQEGTLIDYQLKLYGIPFKWRTQIMEWKPPYRFVDFQLRGPYKLWRHTHTFEPVDGGTLIKDHVKFELPFGRLGRLAAGFKVKRDVTAIFDYRRQVIIDTFGEKK